MVINFVFIWEEEACSRGVVDTTLVLHESSFQGKTKAFCMVFCKAEDFTLERAGVCLAGGPHPLCNLIV